MILRFHLRVILILMCFCHLAMAQEYSTTGPVIPIGNDIGVGYQSSSSSKLFVFDTKGNFLREIQFNNAQGSESGTLRGTTENGSYVFVDKERGKDYQTRATKITLYDRAGKLQSSISLDGEWFVQPGSQDRVFVEHRWEPGETTTPEFVDSLDRTDIQLLDVSTGKQESFASTRLEKPGYVFAWYVSASGNVFLLEGGNESTVHCYSKDGHKLWSSRSLSSDVSGPLISPAIFQSPDADTLYLFGADSWGTDDFTFLAVGSQGEVENIRLPEIQNPQFLMLLQDGRFAVLSDNRIAVLSPASFQIQTEWLASPPAAGETWASQRKLEIQSSQVTVKSSTQDLLNAFVYGPDDVRKSAEQWLEGRGGFVIPDVLRFYLRLTNSQLYFLLTELKEKYPDVASAAALKEFSSANHEQKKILLPLVFNNPDTMDPAVIEFLSELNKGGKDDQETAQPYLLMTSEGKNLIRQALASLPEADTEEKLADLYRILQSNPTLGVSELIPYLESEDAGVRDKAESLLCDQAESAMDLREAGYVEPTAYSSMKPVLEGQSERLRQLASILRFTGGDVPSASDAVRAVASHPRFLSVVVNAFGQLKSEDAPVLESHSAELVSLVLQSADFNNDDLRLAYYNPIYKLAALESPAIHRALLFAVVDESMPAKARHRIRDAMTPGLESAAIQPSVVLEFLKQGGNQVDPGKNFWDLLGMIASSYDDPQIKDFLRGFLKSRAAVADSNTLFKILGIYHSVATREDIPFLMPLLDASNVGCGGGVIGQTLEVLDDLGPVPEIEERLVSWLANSDLRYTAARVLSRLGRPEALPVLLDELKNGYESRLRARHFAPYGSAAEDQLLPLMLDEGSAETARRATLVLTELKSAKAHSIVRDQFKRQLESGEVVEPALTAGLLFYGEDPLPEIFAHIDARACHSWEQKYSDHFPGSSAPALFHQLETILMQTTDPARAELILCAFDWPAWQSAQKNQILRRVKQNHPSPEIRDLIHEAHSFYYTSSDSNEEE